jgi:hypothetical protein
MHIFLDLQSWQNVNETPSPKHIKCTKSLPPPGQCWLNNNVIWFQVVARFCGKQNGVFILYQTPTFSRGRGDRKVQQKICYQRHSQDFWSGGASTNLGGAKPPVTPDAKFAQGILCSAG